MKCRPYLYFLSKTKARTEQGHCSAFIFYNFCNTCSKYLRIKLFVDGLLNCKNHESFVPQNFWRIQYNLAHSQTNLWVMYTTYSMYDMRPCPTHVCKYRLPKYSLCGKMLA